MTAIGSKPLPTTNVSINNAKSDSLLRFRLSALVDLGLWTSDLGQCIHAPHLLPRPPPPRHHRTLPAVRPGTEISRTGVAVWPDRSRLDCAVHRGAAPHRRNNRLHRRR